MKQYKLSTEEIKQIAHETAMKEISRMGIIAGETNRFVPTYTKAYNQLRAALENYNSSISE